MGGFRKSGSKSRQENLFGSKNILDAEFEFRHTWQHFSAGTFQNKGHIGLLRMLCSAFDFSSIVLKTFFLEKVSVSMKRSLSAPA